MSLSLIQLWMPGLPRLKPEELRERLGDYVAKVALGLHLMEFNFLLAEKHTSFWNLTQNKEMTQQ